MVTDYTLAVPQATVMQQSMQMEAHYSIERIEMNLLLA